MYDNLPKPHSYLILNYVSKPFQLPQSPPLIPPPVERGKTPGKNLSHYRPRFFYFLGKMPTHFRVRKKEKIGQKGKALLADFRKGAPLVNSQEYPAPRL